MTPARPLVIQLAATLAFAVVACATTAAAAPAARTLSRSELLDRIRGAWAGQMIGVSYGEKTEFKSNGRMIEGDFEKGAVSNSIHQDDLYVEMTFAQVLEEQGLDAPMSAFAEMFRASRYKLWHANAAARRLLDLGIPAPLSGHPLHNLHADDIDFQIEADFIGIMCPGLPGTANAYCDRIGRIMNHGDGLYGGMFVGGMYAAAYFERDVRKVVEAGLAGIPEGSAYAAVIRDVLAWSAEHPGDWKATWRALAAKWDGDDICPDGALADFNIDAKLNGAFIALGLLHGGGDFVATMDIATRCGQDSDCNPSSAAGILGAMHGFERLPGPYREAVWRVARQKFQFTDYSFNDIVASSERQALELIRRAGGSVDAHQVAIPALVAVPPSLEQCHVGRPVRAHGCDDPAWSWLTGWNVAEGGRDRRTPVRVADGPGAVAELRFTGTGVALQGALGQDGGRADVVIDGQLQTRPLEGYIPPETYDGGLWHRTDLADGEHVLRIVTRAQAHPRSTGTRVTIRRAVIFQK